MDSVTRTTGMFAHCFSLEEINIGNNDIGNIENRVQYSTLFLRVGSKRWPCHLIIGDSLKSKGYDSDSCVFTLCDGTFTLDKYDRKAMAVYADSTLTFLYNNSDSTVSHGDNTYAVLNSSFEKDWGNLRTWYNIKDSVKTIVFDPSFSQLKPTYTDYWFSSFSKLTDIKSYIDHNIPNHLHDKYSFIKAKIDK